MATLWPGKSLPDLPKAGSVCCIRRVNLYSLPSRGDNEKAVSRKKQTKDSIR